jgi:hypothetical protein
MAAKTFDGRRKLVRAADVPVANQALLAIEKKLNAKLTALDVWDYTIYPFQQSLVDLTGMMAAVDALTDPPISYKAALRALENVNLSWYGYNFSYPVYYQNLLQRVPGYAYANMADLGNMAMTLDVMPEYYAVLAARTAHTVPADAIAGLQAKIAAEKADIVTRLEGLTTMLDEVAGQITAITPATR